VNLRSSSTIMVSTLTMLKPNDAKIGTPGHLDTVRQLVRLRGSTEVLVHWEGSSLTISITEVDLKHRLGGSCYGTALHVMYKQGIWSPKALCYMCMQGIMTISKRMCIDPSCWVHDNKALAVNIFSNSQSVASVGSCISHITCMQSVPYHIMPNVLFSFCKRTACRSSLGSLM